MAIATRISNDAYERLALAEPGRKWELWDGHPREKPGMTYPHNRMAAELGFTLRLQLNRDEFEVRVDAGRVHRPGATYVIPDVFVFPVGYVTPALREGDILEVYDQPLPFVAEVWSRSTGDYDRGEKLAIYQQRGDREIWYLHPIDRTLTTRRKQPDGSYSETLYTGGIVPVPSLPGVAIDLDALFAL